MAKRNTGIIKDYCYLEMEKTNMNKYGLKITYSWGDEEPLIKCKTKDLAWRMAKKMATPTM